jgi:glutathione S-transferase
MTDIILHHYETSPYSEKVRLGLGLKAWRGISRDSDGHAKTRPDSADRRLPQDASLADRR